MEKYIIFLRGINVGGKNKVSMPSLKKALEAGGFNNVSTYINSGNVLFASENDDLVELTKKSEDIIQATFDLEVPVCIVPVKELAATLNHQPEWWDDGNKEIIHYAIFLIPPISVAEVFAAVGEIKPEFEKISYYDNVIFWSAPRKTFNKARWSKIANTSANKKVTLRNANTVNKMIELSSL